MQNLEEYVKGESERQKDVWREFQRFMFTPTEGMIVSGGWIKFKDEDEQ